MNMKKLAGIVITCLIIGGGSSICGKALGQKVTLKVWVPAGHLESSWAQYIYPKYKAEHPEIKLEFLDIPEGEYERKYYMALQARKGPDVVWFYGETFGDYVHAGALSPMPEDLRQKFWGSGVFSYFHKIFDYGGKTYALNDNIGPYLLHYNKTMFAEAGLTSPPKTFDEFVTAAKKTTKYDEKGEIIRVGYAIRHIGHIPGSVGKWLPFLYSAGGTFIDPEGKRVLFNSSAGRQALQLYVDLIWKHRASSLEFPDPRDAFIEGIAAMQVSECIKKRLEEEAPKLSYGLAFVPAAAGKKSETVFDCNLWGVSPQSKHKREAWEFLLWQHTAKYIKERILRVEDVIPLRPETSEDPDLKDMEFIRIALAALPGAHPYPLAPNFREICGIFWSYVEKALHRKMTVEDALSEAERKANEALARWR